MINPISFIISAISLIIAITIHEFAHALIADRLGDPTPRSQGRLTLNPLKHLDPLGTVMLLLFQFGWGKPVQIDAYNLKNPRRDELFISLAGPVSNLILATLLAILIKIIPQTDISFYLISGIIQFNIVLAIFNLLPIPPLDGSKILINILPENKSQEWESALTQYGPLILLAAVFLKLPNGQTIISLIISPLISFILKLLLF